MSAVKYNYEGLTSCRGLYYQLLLMQGLFQSTDDYVLGLATCMLNRKLKKNNNKFY